MEIPEETGEICDILFVIINISIKCNYLSQLLILFTGTVDSIVQECLNDLLKKIVRDSDDQEDTVQQGLCFFQELLNYFLHTQPI